MFFTVSRGIEANSISRAFLIPDNWDDWFQFQTAFTLFVVDEGGRSRRMGTVKIARIGLLPGREIAPGTRAPEVPEAFDNLDPPFFSLGMGEDYYESLNALSEDLKGRVLHGLRDCAFDLAIFEAAQNEPSMTTSLLRSVTAEAVRGKLHRLTLGDAQPTEFRFKYTFPRVAPDLEPPRLDFNVVPKSEPPTNVHVLIGRNGVGKTRAIRLLVENLLGRTANAQNASGTVVIENVNGHAWSFSGLVLISFSAFDNYDLVPQPNDRIPSEQVGLRYRVSVDGVERGGIKDPAALAEEFRKSLERCRTGLRSQRWRAAVATLASDDLFAEANVGALLEPDSEGWAATVERHFSRLSSGHAIVLLTVTRLVELVDEKTLVLLDEPEGHLHPPLLSAFIRCLSDLLVNRNGVAIVATHSPVVLQEAPRTCAWKLRRGGAVSVAERPVIETFGENISILTREVFGLEVTKSGFHNLLMQAVNDGSTYEQIVARFDGQLGAEARAIAQALVADRDQAAGV